MSTEQHEALKLADQLSPDLTTVLRIDAENAGEMLRTQHALIVQMAEALINAEALFPCQMYADALDAATQYLKGPKT